MSAFGAATKTAKNHPTQKLSVVITEELLPFTQSIAEAVSLANYQPSAAYKTGKAAEKLKKNLLRNLFLFSINLYRASKLKPQKNFQRGLEIGKTANEVKDWVNAPPNFATPHFLTNLLKKSAKKPARN